jgi:hypothetical protein
MLHCCKEKSAENDICRSSQLFGDSTAQTVMISSIAFMPMSSGASSSQYHSQLRDHREQSFTRAANTF